MQPLFPLEATLGTWRGDEGRALDARERFAAFGVYPKNIPLCGAARKPGLTLLSSILVGFVLQPRCVRAPPGRAGPERELRALGREAQSPFSAGRSSENEQDLVVWVEQARLGGKADGRLDLRSWV